ncbi:hypothetical protein CHU93_16825 [Sandarakinorhabdus cyanobacteriorum]|uniref:Guanylate cyclase domain-containing protein n=1 Tax=Sandarakinorhabdus cyanobacteriorum TaxID=1981098 RepID=A0A255Y3R3_9SPHN|nr:adenylate/guanylate cyclase domain-containing protein [Sandarakinorhabdus cyanobacteriorum]OYQ23856.1 hypothetical protein CHU93_16825 [Sandarakinorhabdus cyanobacteriorum]
MTPGAEAVMAEGAVRCHLTLCFSDLCDSTAIAAGLEPEDYAALLQQLRSQCEQIIGRHGGEILRIDGDGLLAMFGHPQPHADSGRRAAMAALELHAAAAALEVGLDRPIRLHSGIHSGTVLVQPGDLVRGRFEVLGDATNVAARLCDAAAPGEIIASAEALGADLAFFGTGPQRACAIGGNRTVAAFSILNHTAPGNRFSARERRGLAPFTGRAEQLASVHRLLAECAAGAMHCALLIGPGGIGKTRLATAFLEGAAASGARIVRGDCDAYLGAPPLQPFLQIAAAIAPDAVAENAAGLAATILDWLGQQPLPAIVMIDDWHWADDGSRAVLDMVRAAAPRGCLLLLASRNAEAALADARPLTRISLPALSTAEAGGAIAGMLPAADPFTIEALCARAGGSPLFIEELCHAARARRGVLPADKGNAWLDMLVQERFSRLGERERELVNVAAVIGQRVPAWLFEAVTGVAGDDPVLATLAAQDFLYAQGDMLQFKHGLTRDAIYRAIGLNQQRALHRQVVAALDAQCAQGGEDPWLEALAYHHAAARNHERAGHYALLAGDRAMAASALDRGQAQYRAAVTAYGALAAAGGDRKPFNRVIHRFGLACVPDPAPDQIETLETAARQCGDDPTGQTLCQYWMGTINYGLGRARQSIACLQRALITIDATGNNRLKLQLQANLGQAYLADGQVALAEHWLNRAIADIESASATDMSEGLAYAHACRGFLLADQGQFAASAVHYDRAETLLAGRDTPLRGSVVTQQAAVAIWQGDFAAAIAYAEAGASVGSLARSRYYMMMSLALVAFARWSGGETAALADLERAAAWFTSATSQQRVSLCYGWLAQIMAGQDRVADARHYAALCLARARQGDRLGEAMAFRALASLAAAGLGRHPAAHYLALANRAADARQSPRELALNRQLEAELAASR